MIVAQLTKAHLHTALKYLTQVNKEAAKTASTWLAFCCTSHIFVLRVNCHWQGAASLSTGASGCQKGPSKTTNVALEVEVAVEPSG